MNNVHSDFLTASGSFLIGVGSIFNIGGSYFSYNVSASPEIADARAIRQDFAMIGQDIRNVVAENDPQLTLPGM
ncbi:MAG TPA: hypothetical protein VHY22_00920 [Chthoniobacteraceae bacterium]|jgi:hypothetical protein|nr:hypothetical protein [Chthoniobacteraceae bacterium]